VLETLDIAQTAALASLLAIGCSSGDTVVGLSKVRRAEKLAYVFADAGLAARTLRELEDLQRRGARVFSVADFAALTGAFGREDASVVGVKPGDLAKGLGKRLQKTAAAED
jgi:hypothetical protein